MYKSLICFLILLAPVLFSCHSGPSSKTANGWPGIPDSVASGMQGAYSGRFKSGLMTLVINYVSGNVVSGYDLHKGIRRNVNGQIEERDGGYGLTLEEPGGNPFDGTFYLHMDKSAQKLSGRWVPTDSTRTHSSDLILARGEMKNESDGSEKYVYDGVWGADLGTLTFDENSTCKLEYYPDSTAQDPHPQRVTVNGNYIQNVDTILIDWQANKHLPNLHMRLEWKHTKKLTDSTWSEGNLHGSGLKFLNVSAG
jgi:hypothetical protein